MKQPQFYTSLLAYEVVPSAGFRCNFMGLLQLTFKDYRRNKRIIEKHKLQKQFAPLTVSYMNKRVSLRSKSGDACDRPHTES